MTCGQEEACGHARPGSAESGCGWQYGDRVLSPEYPIVTERLLLRPLDPVGDVDAVFDYHSRADVCRYLGIEPRSREDVIEFLASPRIRSAFEVPGHAISLAVVLRETQTLIGDASLVWASSVHARGEFGCVLHPDHQGHGYATEACSALLRHAFDELGLHRVIARLDERNTTSQAMMRRLGLRREARFVEHERVGGEWVTELVFAILDSEWRDGC